jgi:hypothetical protein
MQIRARMCISADGCVTTPDGWPAQLADPSFAPGESHGIKEFLETCEAALMGRTTFEPALTTGRWPWPDLEVFVLASERPTGTPGKRHAADGRPQPRRDPHVRARTRASRRLGGDRLRGELSGLERWSGVGAGSALARLDFE